MYFEFYAINNEPNTWYNSISYFFLGGGGGGGGGGLTGGEVFPPPGFPFFPSSRLAFLGVFSFDIFILL